MGVPLFRDGSVQCIYTGVSFLGERSVLTGVPLFRDGSVLVYILVFHL